MARFALLASAAVAVISFPAAAGITVIGNSLARSCYLAAEGVSTPAVTSLRTCDEALSKETLSLHDTVATYVNRGIIKVRRGNLDGGLADFDEAIARDPNQAEAYLNKGATYLRKENSDAALPLFNIAIEKNTRRPAIAYYGRGVAHELRGDLRAAYQDYRQAAALAPNWNVPAEELSRFQIRQN